MENKKVMNVIVSTSIRFTSEDDVKAYRGLGFEALPEDDLEYTEVTRYILGGAKIVLFGAKGQRLAVLERRTVRGMAVDGVPVTVHGPEFKRFDSDEPEPAEDDSENVEAAN